MNYRLTLVACALLALAAESHATGNHTPKEPPSKPAPTPAPPAPTPTVVTVTPQLAAELTPSQVVTLRQQAAAEAAAKAAAEAQAAGGAGTGTAALQQTDQSVHKGSYAVGLNITPAATPAMAAVACPTPEVTQETQFGMIIGPLGRGSSKTSTADCVALTVIARIEDCRPRTTALAENALLAKSIPGFKPPEVPATVQDLTAEECTKRKLERQITSIDQRQYTTIVYEGQTPPAADKPAEPVVPPPAKPKKPNPAKNISTKPPAPKGGGTTLNCGDEGVPQCVAKPRKPLALGGGSEVRS